MNTVLETLEKMKINYKIVNHPPATTTALADEYIEGHEGVRSKTLFLAGKKDRQFYLLILDEQKRLDLKKISEEFQDRLHFASESKLYEKMGLKPGIVSLFGLLNNKEKDIKVYIDKDLLKEKIITFHPNDNIATIFISVKDMFNFLDKLEYNYQIMEF